MANIITDPSFELGTAWVYTGGAERTDAVVPATGDYSAKLFVSSFGPITSVLQQGSLPLETGETYDVRLWVWDQSANLAELNCAIDPGSGVLGNVSNFAVLGGPWRLVILDTFEAVGSVGQFQLNTLTGLGTWYVDDISIRLLSELSLEELVQRGRYESYSGLLTILRGINGASGGYYHDLDTRVRTAWQTPDEIGDRVFSPYLCLPFDGDVEQIESVQKNVYKSTWRQRIYGYVPESSSDPTASKGIEALCHLRDDVLRALMSDYTLGGTVRESRVTGIMTNAGLGLGFGAVEFEIVFEEWFTRDQLGPNAS